jgi:antitoxin MazE
MLEYDPRSKMRKKLSAIGNSLGVVIEKPILELLDIDRDTELEMTTDGQRLIIEPVRARRRRVLASAKKVMSAHDETFRKLAK